MNTAHPYWNPVPVPQRTVFDILNRDLQELQNSNADSLPNLRGAHTLLLGSDYSGESSHSPYMVYSFLLVSLDAWQGWEVQRIAIREAFFSDSRRMSFKRLNDVQRQKALVPLLQAADTLEGLSFTVAMNKSSESIFPSPPLDLSNPDFSAFAKWKRSILEKAFLATHFLSFLMSGLCRPGQDVLWFTDEDSIAANDQRVIELTRLFGWISSLYLSFSMGHCRCGTSRCDNGTMQIEDFLSVPDLIAGAISEQLEVKRNDPKELSTVFWVNRPDQTDKSNIINWWLADSTKQLKRLLCIVDPSKGGKGHLISWYHFHDRNEA